jgi:hypothetical protein
MNPCLTLGFYCALVGFGLGLLSALVLRGDR